MVLLNIYFPSSWWDISILILAIFIAPIIIRWALLSMKKAIDLPYLMVLLLIIILVLIWFIIARAFPAIRDALQNTNVSQEAKPWIWISLAVILLLLIFRKRLTRIKGPKVGVMNWKWLIVPGLIFLVLWGYKKYQVSKLLNDMIPSRNASVVNSTSSSNTNSLQSSERLNMNGKNEMRQGKFFKFSVDYDDPNISFDPQGSDTTALFFQKAEDPTRKWTLYLWKNSKGEKKYRFSPRPPLHEALVGTIYVRSKNNAIVVVSQK